jgi:spore germination cell wall hydrolase CwlJ-like protein
LFGIVGNNFAVGVRFMQERARQVGTFPVAWVQAGVACLLLVSAVAIGLLQGGDELRAQAQGADGQSTLPPGVAPDPPEMLFRETSPERALALNRLIPLAAEPNDPAKPFRISARGRAYSTALDCLAEAAYYEAATDGAEGERAVVQVILNRVRHPAFPNTICGVVYQGSMRTTGCQFTFTCDGSLLRARNGREWAQARAIAASALSGEVYAPVGLATHYHANYVVPYWATTLAKNALVGVHIFYRWRGWWGRSAAFAQHYGKALEDSAQLRNAALIAHGRWPGTGEQVGIEVEVPRSSRLQALSVVQLLADARLQSDRSADVRSRFSALNNAVAVQIYRQLAEAKPAVTYGGVAETILGGSSAPSGPPVQPFLAALDEFAATPTYVDFERTGGNRAWNNAKLATELKSVVADLQVYSGLRLDRARFIVPPLLETFVPSRVSCSARRLGSGAALRGKPDLASRLPYWSADYLQWTRGDSARALNGAAGCGDDFSRQLIGALLSRVADLRSGEGAGRSVIAWEVAHGQRLVPELAARLRFFEKHRDQYPTLADFYPVLLVNMGQRPANQVAASGSPVLS